MALRFTRSAPSAYHAQGTSKAYAVHRHDGAWVLNIRDLTTTAGITHSVGQKVIDSDTFETKSLAVAAADAYESLGDDYQPHEHRHRSRRSTAVNTAYTA